MTGETPAQFVALIRHGAYHQRPGVPSALQPYPLTDEGHQQAEACGKEVARLLEAHGWSLNPSLYASTELRAWQTAEAARRVLVLSGHTLELHQTPALSERSVGSAANLTVQDIEAALGDDPRYAPPPQGWKSDSDYALPFQGAESLMDAGARVAAHLREVVAPVAEDTAPQLTLVFGHGASFRHAAFHLGVLSRAEIARFSMYHAKPLLLCYNAPDRWCHFGGDWKQRSRTDEVTD